MEERKRQNLGRGESGSRKINRVDGICVLDAAIVSGELLEVSKGVECRTEHFVLMKWFPVNESNERLSDFEKRS